jgi:predicted TIM-barrel fold metal-dependent hydrolase
MPTTIDADTHIDETEDTWEYMRPGEEAFKPIVGYPSNPDPNRPLPRYWMIDGERQPRLARDDERTRTTVEARELLDVKVRLRDMDSLDVQTHVIYPTMFLIQPTSRADIDLAIKRSYNRWLGDRCAQSGGRLRWMCLPPVMTMDETLEELRWAKDHGAVGVFKKGNDEAGRSLGDPYFYPLWKQANELELAVGIHTGSGIPNSREARGGRARVPNASLPDAFSTVVMNKLPQQFPKIRWGFIEAASGWIPHELYKMNRRLNRLGQNLRSEGLLTREELPAGFEMQRDAMREFNLFVTVLVDEDLPYILKFAGEDNLVVGSDYTHADQSMERHFQDELRARVAKGELTPTSVDKMLYDNPKRLYGL